VSALMQYLIEGDILSFIFSCYTTKIGGLFFAFMVFIPCIVLYIRTRSLILVSIIWLFVGTSFIVLFWEFSFIAFLFDALGIAGIFFEFMTIWRRRN